MSGLNNNEYMRLNEYAPTEESKHVAAEAVLEH